ncbi:Monooxygenase FAD-binding protein [Lasiodiplodia theobromae]|uniref:FAD-dependent monooxygenase andE n=1 Tax=Lasiodiplodia theobromae TaxID=45133 RepID=A0A5N5D775_9PEZI|nr:Monooxygenase FAD-binding protein [Lasiodiplodia theobromae]KAB2573212.1 FAD-dependent monooxygenase andE [Lasiodiplodia theobromae]KAF4543914.1 Monooxygenase FAD-binding protein [Lasiodiplodia theobromae]KAF9629311.1 Monooxygenase FAD-binding protein [Lasiodiplodia theobromae]
MASESKHQVIIVGGGITGLTLALMLQHLKIDYVLLEAYKSVTPNVGASIGLYANGLRVLDQLGVYQDVCKIAQSAKLHFVRDGETGKRLTKMPCGPMLEARHGYAPMFMERYGLLCVLYNHILEKERINTNKKVQKIENFEDRVLVHAEDGTTFEGQIVVGADGVHSSVRKEMWRNAEEQDPGSIPKEDRQNIKCEYACVFGLAKPTPGIAPGDVIAAAKPHSTAGCMGGRNHEIFLFWFWKLPPSMHSCPVDNIPRFTKDDERKELERGGDVIVADNGLRLRDVARNLERSAVTALPHYVMRRWHFGRIVIIGDASHKFNPLVGQGGNSCIESCAGLVNELTAALSRSSGVAAPAWPLDALSSAFAAIESQRVPRLVDMVERCQQAQYAAAWDTWGIKLLAKYIIPLQSDAKATDFYSSFITGGMRLKTLGLPQVEHEWSYDDEKEGSTAAVNNSMVVAGASFALFAAILAARAVRNGSVSV